MSSIWSISDDNSSFDMDSTSSNSSLIVSSEFDTFDSSPTPACEFATFSSLSVAGFEFSTFNSSLTP